MSHSKQYSREIGQEIDLLVVALVLVHLHK